MTVDGNKKWQDLEHNCSYYFIESNGMIVGQVYNISLSKIWGAKIIPEPNAEKSLGLYITCNDAKKAVENYWFKQSRTLNYENSN